MSINNKPLRSKKYFKQMNKPLWIKLVAVSGFLVVALGAFGAHALETVLTVQRIQTFHTAVQYQSFHTLALLGIVCVPDELLQSNWKCYAARSLLLGIGLFCGSLYLLALTDIKTFAMITPLGGISFLMAWIFFLAAVLKAR